MIDSPGEAEFDALVATHRAVVVELYATWCKPCASYRPRFAQAAWEAKVRWPDARVAFVSIDVDRSPGLAKRFGGRVLPATLAVQGTQVARWGRNLKQAELEARIAALCRG
ncbi:MAG: thioredoxin family protein [Halobacteriales archaeon]|nr:thioredoxin family protein [Halobacteriales archaeon]